MVNVSHLELIMSSGKLVHQMLQKRVQKCSIGKLSGYLEAVYRKRSLEAEKQASMIWRFN